MTLTTYEPINNIRHTEHLKIYADGSALHLEIMAVDMEDRSRETEVLHYMALDTFQAYLLWQTLTEWMVKHHIPSYNMARELPNVPTA
jgi:hypothetical protein